MGKEGSRSANVEYERKKKVSLRKKKERENATRKEVETLKRRLRRQKEVPFGFPSFFRLVLPPTLLSHVLIKVFTQLHNMLLDLLDVKKAVQSPTHSPTHSNSFQIHSPCPKIHTRVVAASASASEEASRLHEESMAAAQEDASSARVEASVLRTELRRLQETSSAQGEKMNALQLDVTRQKEQREEIEQVFAGRIQKLKEEKDDVERRMVEMEKELTEREREKRERLEREMKVLKAAGEAAEQGRTREVRSYLSFSPPFPLFLPLFHTRFYLIASLRSIHLDHSLGIPTRRTARGYCPAH